MATEGLESPNISYLTLLLVLLAMIPSIAMLAEQEQSNIPPPRAPRATMAESNGMQLERGDSNMLSASSRSGCLQRECGQRGQEVRSHRLPSWPWKEDMFKARAHEVPSGPNPISNWNPPNYWHIASFFFWLNEPVYRYVCPSPS